MSVGPQSTLHIKKSIRQTLEKRMEDDLNKLQQNCTYNERKKYQKECKGFLKLYKRYISSSEKKLLWNEIEEFPKDVLLDYNVISFPTRTVIKHLLEKLVVVKFNGGFGTRMKCNGPKSLIPVKNDLNFLDLTIQHIVKLNIDYDVNVPLVFMNSFNTIDETEKSLKKYHKLRIDIYNFTQNRYPRLYAKNKELLPSSFKDSNNSFWYPPGHGNFYEAFVESGLLDEFRAADKEFCFVSNIDNLGAQVDCRILNLMTISRENKSPEFIMEVTNKTAADIKGGTLIHYMGKIKLLESLEVPRDHAEDFKHSEKFSHFNTNNLWMNLEAIERLVKENNLTLDVIPNTKRIFINSTKLEVIQLETAAGSAIGNFENAFGIMVPRSRFLPVKTTSDLFLVRSNVFVNDNGKIIMNPLRPYEDVPIIKLADEHFDDYRELDRRIKSIPDCLELHNLTIIGNVYIGEDVVLKCNVRILANNEDRLDIPSGSIFQNNCVTGLLRIVNF